jgi:Zn-dependent protease with chaperone function
MGNTFKTALLLTAMTLFLLFVGQAFGGERGMVLALIFAAIMNFVSYFFSDKIALAAYRAQPVTREQLPRAYEIVERLTQKIGIPMPKMYVIPTDSPNAFATGRNPQHASVAMTEGILNLLTDDEMEGVLAHELGHVRNRDILISSVAATLAGAITLIARMGYWASLFGGGGGRDSRDRGRLRRLLFNSPFRAPANTRPMPVGRGTPGIRTPWQALSKSSMPIRNNCLCRLRRRRPTCLSWLRCWELISRACSRRIRQSQSGSSG